MNKIKMLIVTATGILSFCTGGSSGMDMAITHIQSIAARQRLNVTQAPGKTRRTAT
ncbi:MAG: hypothetical protein MUO76_05040 [Anaerolineaceae bacterium]|nr:hypothetical protein [Anaerolineaceae bacterium]